MQEKILILDFGSQYTQLIARRVREMNVYCEIHPYNKIPTLDESVRGVILSGSPSSVRDENAPKPNLSGIKGVLPLLGVCYGAQYLAYAYGGDVAPAPSREYGRAMLTVNDGEDALMKGLPSPTQVWMSHGDTIVALPEGLYDHRKYRGCRQCRLPYRGRAYMGYPVSSGGLPFDRRNAVAAQFRGRHLRMQSGLDVGEFRRIDRQGVARAVGRRQGGTRTFWRRRFVGCRRYCCTRLSARISIAYSSIRACCARTSSTT